MKFSQKLQIWKNKAVYLIQTCTETLRETYLDCILNYLYLFVLNTSCKIAEYLTFKVCHERGSVFK